ncbi:MAG: hypothetical protein COC05_05885 [Gammaproteobacteria bacterium]|nr:hypothetical protein [bacterium AH-315-E07]PCH59861.1 MAG: hypothetical protein COC05_05885 [Gammaproteobacteria bacterium]
MAEHDEKNEVLDQAEETSRTAVERGEDIQNEVRDITLKALSEGRLDAKRTQQVIKAVLLGASQGAEAKGTQSRQALLDAMAGVDEALARSTEASKLAIEEAAGRLKDFGNQDLRRALDDLLILEDLFLDTVKDVAKASKETVSETLNDLAQHARNSGTAVGSLAADTVATLSSELQKTLRDTVSTGSDAAIKTAIQLSRAAAGFLEGIADSLQAKTRSKKD